MPTEKTPPPIIWKVTLDDDSTVEVTARRMQVLESGALLFLASGVGAPIRTFSASWWREVAPVNPRTDPLFDLSRRIDERLGSSQGEPAR